MVFTDNCEGRKLKITCYFLCALSLLLSGLCSGRQTDSSDLQLTLTQSGDELAIKIANVSGEFIKINKALSIDPLVGAIHFVIKEKGRERYIQGEVNSSPLSEHSYLDLQPNSFFGGVYDLRFIEKMYGVAGHCYNLQVFYLDKNAKEFNAFEGKIFSRQMEICAK